MPPIKYRPKRKRAAQAHRKRAVAGARRRPATRVVQLRAPGRRAPRAVAPRLIQAGAGMASQSVVAYRGRGVAHPRDRISKYGAPHYWLNSTGSVYNTAPGLQFLASLGQWNSVADTVLIGALIPPLATAYATAPSRFCMKSMTAEVTIANTSTLTAMVDLYDIMVTHDCPISTITAGDVSTPIAAWVNGINFEAAATDPVGVGSQAYLPGSVPTDSQLFKDFYKIKQRKTVILAPNGCHIHRVKVSSSRGFDVNQTGGTYLNTMSGLSGYTMHSIMVVRGMPAAGGVVPATTSGNPVIRTTVSERYTYSYIYENGSTYNYSSLLSLPTTVNQLLLQSPGTGVPVAS